MSVKEYVENLTLSRSVKERVVDDMVWSLFSLDLITGAEYESIIDWSVGLR